MRKLLLDERTINDELKDQIDGLKEEITHLRSKYVLKEDDDAEVSAETEALNNRTEAAK